MSKAPKTNNPSASANKLTNRILRRTRISVRSTRRPEYQEDGLFHVEDDDDDDNHNNSGSTQLDVISGNNNSITSTPGRRERLTSSTRANAASPSPSRFSQEVTLDFDAAPGAIAASAVLAASTPPPSRGTPDRRRRHRQLQQQDATLLGPNMRSPQELGIAMPELKNNEEEVLDTAPKATPVKEFSSPISSSGKRLGRDRSLAAIRSTMTPAAAAAAAEAATSLLGGGVDQGSSGSLYGLGIAGGSGDHNFSRRFFAALPSQAPPSLVTSVSYRGFEMMFGTMPDRRTIVGWCARTRVTLQTLDLVADEEIVRLYSCPATAMVVVTCSNGRIQTYVPIPTLPASPPVGGSGKPLPVASLGKYRWVNGPMVVLMDRLSSHHHSGHMEDSRRVFSAETMDVSVSADYKLLVAYERNIFVYDVRPFDDLSSTKAASTVRSTTIAMNTIDEYESDLVWTTRVERKVQKARISGDGRAIVCVIDGEGIENENPFGCRTYLRDDEDGIAGIDASESTGLEEPAGHSRKSKRKSIASSSAVRYKPGPFLVHEASVTSISFRGYGKNTSSEDSDPLEDGNDLLLTYSDDDNCVRIFSQNSWKQLMIWITPPHTRADWVRGLSALNLGDLESKKKRSRGSAAPSRRPSFGSSQGGGASGDGDSDIVESTTFHSTLQMGNRIMHPDGITAHHGSSAHHHPSAAAGAWIAEITFRSAFPALRLSRISYMKRGSDDAQPAHFESVAAILPAGSVIADSVLPLGDMGMTVEGIWPAWNPWTSDVGQGSTSNGGTLSGSAMAFLGLSSTMPQVGQGFFGDSHMGGSHSPPSELRVVASHPLSGKVVVMEFPLWGDQDFGAMELGSPLRYLLSLADIDNLRGAGAKDDQKRPPAVSLDYESSMLSGRIEKGSRSIEISWRKQGSSLLLPLLPHTSLSKQPKQLRLPPDNLGGESDVFQDLSAIPVPMSLPSLRLPKVDTMNDTIVAIAWWPDENYGGPPQLLTILQSGGLLLYEMPPPWSALEPAMPSYDPFTSANPGLLGSPSQLSMVDNDDQSEEASVVSAIPREYEVLIVPHPDFGIGLRLEGQLDGMPAIAGSYKKHPLTGGQLPAEKTGMIVLGDELLSVNGVSLEGLTFDEIIGTVRQIGADSQANEPLSMKFRPSLENRRRANSSAFSMASQSTGRHDDQASMSSANRRTKEQIIGIKKKGHKRCRSDVSDVSNLDTTAEITRVMTMPDGGLNTEMQQEFSRIIASIPGAMPPMSKEQPDLQSRLVLMPWTYGLGAPDPHRLRGAALLVIAEGSTIHAMRLEVAADCDAEKARCKELGSVDLDDGRRIEHLEAVKTGTDNWCVAVWDSEGHSQLVFVDILERPSSSGGKDDPRVGAFPSSPEFRANFRRHKMFDAGSVLKPKSLLAMRAHTVDFFATLTLDQNDIKQIVVWHAMPSAGSKFGKGSPEEEAMKLYDENILAIGGSSEIMDFRFVSTGSLDDAPLIAVFMLDSVVVYQRKKASVSWEKAIEVAYPTVDTSSSFTRPKRWKNTKTSPVEFYPHLLDALRGVLSISSLNLISDWHPTTIISAVCCDEIGPGDALKSSLKAWFRWIAVDCNRERKSLHNDDSLVSIIPWSEIADLVTSNKDDSQNESEENQSAAALMASFSRTEKIKEKDEQTKVLKQLQQLLLPHEKEKENGESARSKEFSLAMLNVDAAKDTDEELSDRLRVLNKDERLALWAIGQLILKRPKFEKLDRAAQLSLFGVSLVQEIQSTEPQEKDENEAKAEAQSLSALVMHSTAKPTMKKSKPRLVSATSCAVAALTSDTQSRLLAAYRKRIEVLDWEAARAIKLSFWIRSDNQLRKLSEEIGQNLYRQSRDIMQCALYFVISGNMKKLRTLAATDKTHTGKTFFKFITSHDFSSDRGRKAAEKNAFSLLRKQKYRESAALFLLPERPMLHTALETIITKMKDLDLAFLVARLVESTSKPSTSSISLSMMGGGGGYASSIVPQAEESELSDEITFSQWKPKIGKGGRRLLVDRGFEFAEQDNALAAMILMWLGRTEEAAHAFSGSTKTLRKISNQLLFPVAFDKPIPAPGSQKLKRMNPFALGRAGSFSLKQSMAAFREEESEQSRVVSKTNEIIDFVSKPFLVRAMRGGTRAQWACSLQVGQAMTNRGIELHAARSILSTTSPDDFESEEEACAVAVAKTTTKGSIDESASKDQSKAVSKDSQQMRNGGMQSSIFDDYGSGASVTGQQRSGSIFDAYDAPNPKAESSSIFDEFETAHSKPKPKAESSSIFDGFEAAPPKPKPKAESSSIFDGFEAAPQNPRSNSHSGMSSSIFDGFDPPPLSMQQNKKPSSRNDMTSSIFDSFDTAPQRPTRQATTSSSIFDSYETAPQRSSKEVQAATMTSSIFDGFDAAPQKPKMPHTSTTKSPAPTGKIKETMPIVEEIEPDVSPDPTPKLFLEWRNSLLTNSIARRLLREVARLVESFHGNSVDPPMKVFATRGHPLVPLSAAEVLRSQCDGDSISTSVKSCVESICTLCEVDDDVVVEQALRILDIKAQPNKIVIAVLLYSAMDRVDLAEDIVRDAALGQIQRCEGLALANDELVDGGKALHQASSLYSRRVASRVSWQLELCLWLHRGGVVPLSGIVLKETIVAVRAGLVLASWGRNHGCLDAMIRCEPDCKLDHEAGGQLWRSLKLISGVEDKSQRRANGVSSGGWEFLVDCRREEATRMLKNRPPGSFIIRPHPENNGVFTLSFKTNLIPPSEATTGDEPKTDNGTDGEGGRPPRPAATKPVRKDDVVQHAIIRLSDAGFRCGSFGPFATLLKLLEAVSNSLPFDLLFDRPPTEGIIKDEDAQPSPNAVFLRKYALSSSNWKGSLEENNSIMSSRQHLSGSSAGSYDDPVSAQLGLFSQLLTLSEIRKQLSAVAAADYEDIPEAQSNWENAPELSSPPSRQIASNGASSAGEMENDDGSMASFSIGSDSPGVEEQYTVAARILRPLLVWCRALETRAVYEIAPMVSELSKVKKPIVKMAISDGTIEVGDTAVDGGDAMIRNMIQPQSGVQIRTLKVGEGGDSAMIILFNKADAISYLMRTGAEVTEKDAEERLSLMEQRRVIEAIAQSDLSLKGLSHPNDADEPTGVRFELISYRIVDPWEVEAVESREGEFASAALGRERYYAFSVAAVTGACEGTFRKLGGSHLLSLWTNSKGGLRLTKALASVHPPWERDAGSDLPMAQGQAAEATPYVNAVRQHLYRNALFRRLQLPQRFMALVQVELLDLKNLNTPTGASLSVYALLRLKRIGSSAPLTLKARTLDSAATHPVKINKSAGGTPNAPASWGSLVRFRYPLPESTRIDGVSNDKQCQALFRGPPAVLQFTVYEKKFMSDISLGGADVKLDALVSGGQLEEWVPLRSEKHGINWFARIRLTLRFELLCLPVEMNNDGSVGVIATDGVEEPVSVGLRKIQHLSRVGGAHEDLRPKKSASTPDLISYWNAWQ